MPHTLFTPGPTPVPDAVLQSIALPVIHHRSPEAQAIISAVNSGLQELFHTRSAVLALTCSATGAGEAIITSLHSHGEKVLVLNNGRFAARWGAMLRTFGMNVTELTDEWGMPADTGALAAHLKQNTGYATVWLTHSETSTGALSNLREVARIVKESSDALLCVDGVSSVAVHEIRMDEWGIDALFTGSQKGLMLPPGLAFVALSTSAQRRMATADLPSYYFDLRRAYQSAAANTTPWTPAITLLRGAVTAIHMIRTEGIENVWLRHANNAAYLRKRLTDAGYSLFSSSRRFAHRRLHSRRTHHTCRRPSYTIRHPCGQRTGTPSRSHHPHRSLRQLHTVRHGIYCRCNG
ncbi:MAG: alanine--glyoxylate aminotransferase family protein [Candidatus Kapabacteria bacterium]|nr:alanine--glyoxylate aminotransferase family protein [Candidatus Kapabacteria bacterium]